MFNCDEKLKIAKMKVQMAQEKLGMKTDIIIPKNTMNSDKCKHDIQNNIVYLF